MVMIMRGTMRVEKRRLTKLFGGTPASLSLLISPLSPRPQGPWRLGKRLTSLIQIQLTEAETSKTSSNENTIQQRF